MVSYENLFICGIGASAGGFEAFQEFLPRIANVDNITYVIAQHLDPKQPTLFGELLSRYSICEISPVIDGENIEARQTVHATSPPAARASVRPSGHDDAHAGPRIPRMGRSIGT